MLIYDRTTPETIRSTIYLSALILIIGYCTLNVFLPNNDMNLIVGMMQVVMATMVLCYYIVAAIKAVFTGSSKNVDFLIVGIVLSWISTDGQAALALLARLSGFPPALMNSELFPPLKLLSVIAAILHVIPRGAADGVVPKSNKATVVGFVLVSLILAAILVVAKPDPTNFINSTPPWMRDFWETGQVSADTPSQG